MNIRLDLKLTCLQPLTAKVAADQKCTGNMGGMSNVCMVRCNNAANAGPFGGCVPVTMPSGGTNSTAASGTASGKAPQSTGGAVKVARDIPFA